MNSLGEFQRLLDAASAGEASSPWPAELPHVSASFFKLFSACPEQARQRYILGRRIRPAAATLWGRADHTAAAFNYRQKLESSVDLPTSDVMDVFAGSLDHEVDQAGGVNELDWESAKRRKEDPVKGTAARRKELASVKDRGVKLVRAYHELVAPSMLPSAVEQRFEFTLPGVPVPVIGYIDLLAAGPDVVDNGKAVLAEGRARLVERKTTAQRKSKPERDWSFQTGLYQLARWLPVEYQLSVKTRDPVVQAHEPGLVVKASTARKRFIERAVRSVVAEIGWCYRTFGPDEPWPAVRALLHTWRCDFCGFRPDCSWWR